MVLPRQSGSFATEFVAFLRDKQFAQVNFFAMRVRQFDADGVAAGHDGDARRERAHRARDVVGEADHARRLDAGRGLEFVQRHDRTGIGLDDFAADAEVAEHDFQRARIGIQLRLAERLAIGRLGRSQHRHRRAIRICRMICVPGELGAAFLRGARAAGASSSSSSSSSKSSSACGARDGAARPPRLGSWRSNDDRARRRRARDQPAIGRGQQPAEPRLGAHHGMKRPSQRDRAAVVLFAERRVVVLDRRQFFFLRA